MKNAVTLRWTNVDKGRYYQATVQPDLFGGWVVMRFWGQLGSQLGGQLFVPVADPPAGEVALRRISEVRERRGYRPAAACLFGLRPEEGTARPTTTARTDGPNEYVSDVALKPGVGGAPAEPLTRPPGRHAAYFDANRG